MQDLYKEAKNRIKSKNNGRDSKLDYSDIRDIIILGMIDGILTRTEIKELKDIKRYSYDNMQNDAKQLYLNFMAGVLGELNHTKDYSVNIIGRAEGMLAFKNIRDEPLIFTEDDIKDLLLMSIRDGILTTDKVDQLIKVKSILNNRCSSSGAKLFVNFARAYHKRLYPNHKSTQTVQNLNRSNTNITWNKNTGSLNKNNNSNINSTSYGNQSISTSRKQCGFCYGNGNVTCSSCYGMGGRSESRTEYDYNGNTIYRTEFISCYSCSGGYSKCFTCGGTGQV